MAETPDAVMPVWRKIQEDLSAIRKEQQASKERDIQMADAIIETQNTVAAMRKDSLLHLGLTTKHRMVVDELQEKLDNLIYRVETLEARP